MHFWNQAGRTFPVLHCRPVPISRISSLGSALSHPSFSIVNSPSLKVGSCQPTYCLQKFEGLETSFIMKWLFFSVQMDTVHLKHHAFCFYQISANSTGWKPQLRIFLKRACEVPLGLRPWEFLEALLSGREAIWGTPRGFLEGSLFSWKDFMTHHLKSS